MNSSALSTPARRTAAALTTAAIALGPVLFGATSAHAAPRDGKADAVVLRANLKVKALDVAEVPLDVELNDVDAPRNENERLLDAKVKGIHGGRSFNMIRAQVATADAKVNQRRAVGEARLVNAHVKLPGLGRLGSPLVDVELATAKATCVAGEKPRAKSKVVGLKVLGQKVDVPLNGTRKVPNVEGVGRVTLGLAETRTTARNAIATAVRLNVTVKTLAQTKVKGTVILSQATCRAPLADEGDTNGGTTEGNTDGGQTDGGSTEGNTDGGQTDGGQTDGGATEGDSDGATTGTAGGDTAGDDGGATAGEDGGATTGGGGLAETGSSSTTPYLAAGAGLLMVAGAGALVLTKRRRAATAQQD